MRKGTWRYVEISTFSGRIEEWTKDGKWQIIASSGDRDTLQELTIIHNNTLEDAEQ